MTELTQEQLKQIKEIYEELKAIESSLPTDRLDISRNMVDAYHNLLSRLNAIIGHTTSSQFSVSPAHMNFYSIVDFRIQIRRLIAHLTTRYHLESAGILGIGNVIRIIQDDELKKRCLDLIASEGNFDRVIREATTILENRIRSISDPNLRQVGVDLVDKVLNPKSGILEIVGQPNEQEGYYQLFRGVMLSFRDEAHHRILDSFTREDAIKTLAFIDILLSILKKSEHR